MEDKWSDWLLRKRFGGDEQAAARGMAMLRGIRDTVLDGAAPKPGETLLDIGAGDGLIAFGAVQRIGSSGVVILLDVSQPLLDHAAASAREMGVMDQCRFVRASAERLDGIADASVDAVTCRSVLIYVAAKQDAFREMHRVLRPGGRISVWEPINRFEAESPAGLLGALTAAEPRLGLRLRDYYRDLQPLDTDPMLNFDERDLFRFCEEAGFRTVVLTTKLLSVPAPSARWEAVIHSAANPNVPSLHEAMEQVFNPSERRAFEDALRPLVEVGGHPHRSATAHLIATK